MHNQKIIVLTKGSSSIYLDFLTNYTYNKKGARKVKVPVQREQDCLRHLQRLLPGKVTYIHYNSTKTGIEQLCST